jgi:hypothetical protein
MGLIFNQRIYLKLSINLFVLVLVLASQLNAQSLQSTSEYLKKSEKTASENLNNLLTKIQTTVYLETSTLKTFGEGNARCLKSDIASISMLNAQNAAFTNIELIEITLAKKGDDKISSLKASLIANFPKLKYLLIKSEFELGKQEFESIIADFKNTNIVLLYEVSIPQ